MMLDGSLQRIKLKEVCDRITVGHVGSMADKYVAAGIPFLRSQNVMPFRLNLDDIKYIPADFHEKLRKSALRAGDVVVVRTGYPGTACVIPKLFSELNCADLVVITPSAELNPYFLAAIFNSAWGMASVGGNLVGVAQQHFNIGAAKELQILLPSRRVQDRIAGILSAYDDLIENNRRRIKILEEMARALYREWFVHFRFPGHENHPRVSSPLGEIPKGWDGAFSDIAAMEREAINPSDFHDEQFEHFSIPAFDNGRAAAIERGATILSNKYVINASAVLLSKLNPRIPRIWLPEPSGTRRAIASTEFLVLKAKEGFSREFIYAKCCSVEFAGQFASLAIGTSTSHQRVKPENLLAMHTTVPNREVVERFTNLVAPLLAMGESLRAKTQNLRRTRDLLLPRLLSGQIDLEAA